MSKILNDTEQINQLFQRNYSKEIINKVKSFYFNECNMECGTTRLENICHVSVPKSQTNYESIFFFFLQNILIIIYLLYLYFHLISSTVIYIFLKIFIAVMILFSNETSHLFTVMSLNLTEKSIFANPFCFT